jgi:Trypsin-like peptidase domain
MRRTFVFCILALFAAFSGSPALAKGPFGSIKIGQWTGGAFTDDKSGAFSHCAASAPYLNGTTLFVSRAINDQWTVAFANTSFNFPTGGQPLAFDVIFDGQKTVRLFGGNPVPQLLAAPLPDISPLRKSHLMVAEINGTTYQFQLKSIERVVASVERCLVKTKAAGIANAGDFSAPDAKPVVQTTSPNPTVPKSTKTEEQSGTGFLVSTSGHVITNYHVINGCVGDISANFAGQPTTVLRVVSTDEINDLALLQTTKTSDQIATIRATAIHPGDAIIAIGFPLHGLLTSDFTVTSGIVSSLSGLLNDTRYLQISAEVQTGNSEVRCLTPAAT